MKTIKVKVSETILKDDVYFYNDEEYVSINGEQSDGSIDLIQKDEWDLMMKEGLDLINSTQALIDSLKG
jgi:hypothetical protein